jgi:hypothetical protein
MASRRTAPAPPPPRHCMYTSCKIPPCPSYTTKEENGRRKGSRRRGRVLSVALPLGRLPLPPRNQGWLANTVMCLRVNVACRRSAKFLRQSRCFTLDQSFNLTSHFLLHSFTGMFVGSRKVLNMTAYTFIYNQRRISVMPRVLVHKYILAIICWFMVWSKQSKSKCCRRCPLYDWMGWSILGGGELNGLSPQANYTDRYTHIRLIMNNNSAALVRERPQNLSAKLVPTSADRGMSCSQSDGSLWPYSRFSRQEPLLFLPDSSSRGWVDPVPDPLFLRKSGSAGNRTRDLWIWSQEQRRSSTEDKCWERAIRGILLNPRSLKLI